MHLCDVIMPRHILILFMHCFLSRFLATSKQHMIHENEWFTLGTNAGSDYLVKLPNIASASAILPGLHWICQTKRLCCLDNKS